MSKRVYFVVAVDLDTKEVFVDDERFVALSPKEESTFDTITGEWSETDWDDEFIPAQEILLNLIEKENN